MDFETWWLMSGQLDESGKDDWRACWEAAASAERGRMAREWYGRLYEIGGIAADIGRSIDAGRLVEADDY